MKDYLLKTYDPGLDIFGYAQEYRGIKLYPILLKDIKYQKIFYEVMCRPKLYLADRTILKSSYLKFLIYIVQSTINYEGHEILDDLLDFLKYITKKEVSISYREIGGEGLESIELQLIVDGQKLNEYEFEDIREIVLEQNGLSISYIEDYSPAMEEHLQFYNRKSEDLSLQDEIFTFCALQKMSVKELENYTIFQFKNSMEKVLVLKEFDLYKPLLVSGQIELKSGEIKNYLYRSMKNGRYDSIKVDVDDFVQNSDVIKATKPIQ
jgi:hypothetical protein